MNKFRGKLQNQGRLIYAKINPYDQKPEKTVDLRKVLRQRT